MPKLVIDNDMEDRSTVTDVFLITKQFKTQVEFSQYIEKLASKTNSSLIDILVEYCVKQEIEIESVKKLVTPSLKEKIKVEAEDLNLMKEKTVKLPF
jgi:branched-subunit amino acid transport protein AzlD